MLPVHWTYAHRQSSLKEAWKQEKATYAAGSEIGQLHVPIVHGYVDVLESGCVKRVGMG